MAILYNLYSDPQCNIPKEFGRVGALYLNETLRNKSNWNQSIREVPPQFVGGKTGLHFYSKFGILRGDASTSPNTAWWSLYRSYGGYGLFAPNYIITDNKTQSDATKVPNAFFISKHDGTSPTEENYDGSCIVLQIHNNQPYPTTVGTTAAVSVQIIQYGQNPSPSDGERTQWDYFTSSAQQLYSLNISQNNDSFFSNIGFARITLPWGDNGENINFIAVVGNFDDNGEFQPTNTGYTGCIMLFPEELWVDSENIPDPYVGPVTKESVEGSFVGAKIPYKDSISGRSDMDTDPFGLSSVTPYLALMELTAVEYQWMVRSVFCGSNTIDLGSIEDLISDVFGEAEFISEGQTHGVPMPKHRRNTDEVEVMTKGILSSKLIPSCFTIEKGGKLVDASICGLSLNFSTPFGVRCLSSIGKTSFTSKVIERRLNSFLDYEPYTTMQIFVPFCGKLSISPSMVYGNQLKFEFSCDLITGTLSCDISIVEESGRSYIYTTMQGNCGIDIPMVGAAGNNIAAFTSMVGGLASMANSAIINPMAAALAIPTTAQSILGGIREAQIDTPVIDRGSSNINPYFSPRNCYLIINVPKPANPKAYISLHGGVINASGTVGSFATAGSNGGSESGGTKYAVFRDVDLDGVQCTQAEKEEIYRLLRGGVFL